ncbi:MAG: prealbumin-like fold domain-containing protein [Bacteroidota bacterium]
MYSKFTKLGFTALLLAALTLTMTGAALADNPSGCDFSPANNGSPNCLGALSGSTFAGGDGNLQTSPTAFGTTDWQNVAGLNPGFDLPSGSGDNAFGQGTKEDNPNVTVVNGSIPPNKSDLTRFYEASEIGSNNHNFLYLGWERTNVLGTANFDFEINQKTQPDLTTSGSKTLLRTAGDLLVTYDFTNGGGRPSIGLFRWLTSATTPAVPNFATNACFSSSTFPCWGDQVTLDGTDSIAAVNNLDPVADPLFSSSANYINPVPALQFGETAIDLTKAGVFPAGTCEAFGSAFVRSRSSASFTAEIKDFIAPIPVNISNCGEVVIIKHSDPRGINQSFSFTSTIAGSQLNCSSDPTPDSFTLNDSGNTNSDSSANTEDCKNVPQGNYTVTEGSGTANFVLEGLVCTATGTGSSGKQDSPGSLQADITVAPSSVLTCTYQNQQQLGAIKIIKTSSKAAATPLSGATFSITGPNNYSNTVSTGSNGTVCVDALPFGTYSVTETKAPSGYAIDNSTAQSAAVSANAKCSDSTYLGASASFTDTPLTDLLISATSEVSGGTKSTITCVDSSNNNIGNSPQGPIDPAKVAANGLKPGTYTCTVIVDP